MSTGRGSMSVEKFFQRESSTFQFASEALFAVLIVVSGSVYFRFVVRFCMVCGAHECWFGCALAMLPERCGKRNFKRRRRYAPYIFFYRG